MRDDCFQNDKLIISKANDTVYLAEKRFCPCFYGFLNEYEAQIIKERVHFDENCFFWGGYPDASRVMFGAGVNSKDDFPLKALKFIFKKEYKLTHRDFLGSLMALGIERSTIGDILVFEAEAVVFVKAELVDYIKQEVSKIGRVGVKIVDQDVNDIKYSAEYDELSFTVSSLRLDVFVATLSHTSRDKSQQLIKSDLVSVNHKIENNVSKALCVGDVITIRKFGKFVFAEQDGLSKKGKLRVLVKHFR